MLRSRESYISKHWEIVCRQPKKTHHKKVAEITRFVPVFPVRICWNLYSAAATQAFIWAQTDRAVRGTFDRWHCKSKVACCHTPEPSSKEFLSAAAHSYTDHSRKLVHQGDVKHTKFITSIMPLKQKTMIVWTELGMTITKIYSWWIITSASTSTNVANTIFHTSVYDLFFHVLAHLWYATINYRKAS